ncbi:hypothetical protein CRENBAI_007477 [Crenichthys baileyi]|uniref:Uncharacterized protein n=1 Tax=Crenichthys baileyi TaxID=28760 RepID=A0AAV9RV00_9TELE
MLSKMQIPPTLRRLSSRLDFNWTWSHSVTLPLPPPHNGGEIDAFRGKERCIAARQYGKGQRNATPSYAILTTDPPTIRQCQQSQPCRSMREKHAPARYLHPGRPTATVQIQDALHHPSHDPKNSKRSQESQNATNRPPRPDSQPQSRPRPEGFQPQTANRGVERPQAYLRPLIIHYSHCLLCKSLSEALGICTIYEK